MSPWASLVRLAREPERVRATEGRTWLTSARARGEWCDGEEEDAEQGPVPDRPRDGPASQPAPKAAANHHVASPRAAAVRVPCERAGADGRGAMVATSRASALPCERTSGSNSITPRPRCRTRRANVRPRRYTPLPCPRWRTEKQPATDVSASRTAFESYHL